MKKRIRNVHTTGKDVLIVLGILFLLCLNSKPIRAQVDLYPFPKIEEIKSKKGKEAKPAEPFVRALSKKLNIAENLLTKTVEKGFGRTEIIRLILISQKANKPFEDLIKEREKGTRLAKIAESEKLDNKAIREEANAILKDLEKEEEKLKAELTKSSITFAGTDEVLTKGGTEYQSVSSTETKRKKN